MLGARLITDGRAGGVKGVVGLFISGFQLLGGCVGWQCSQMKMQEKELFTLLCVAGREQGNC